MNAIIVEKLLIQNGARTELFAVATSDPHPLAVCWELTYESYLSEWTTDREQVIKLQQSIEVIQ